MACTAKMSLVAFLTIFLFSDYVSAQAKQYRLCVPETTLSTCQDMIANVTENALTCVSANDKIGCIAKVVKNEADFLPLEPEEMYVAHRFQKEAFYVITEVRSNEFQNRDFKYEPVAVVRNSAQISTVSDLKGKRSCHTGYGRNAGWKIPFSHLMEKGELTKFCDAIDAPTPERDVYAFDQYFTKACAPGKWVPEDDADQELKRKYPDLCSLCKNPETCGTTKDGDAYTGYTGALKCLTENNGDVAWTKMDAVEEFFRLGKENPSPLTSQFSFLCWDGSSVPLTAKDRCSWAKRPWKGYLASSRFGPGAIKEIQEQVTLFRKIASDSGKTANIVPVWLLKVLEFNTTDVAFHYNPNEARTITPIVYLDRRNYSVTIEKPSCSSKRIIRFCVRSELEQQKCMDFRMASFGQRVLPMFDCVLGEHTEDCMQMVKNGQADIMTADAKSADVASRDYSLSPILSELELEGDRKVPYRLGLAVVKKETTFRNISDLKGKRSCHGSIKSLAGWNIPLSVLRDAGEISGSTCGLTLQLATYFNATCVPGTMEAKKTMSWLPTSLCSLCAGDGEGPAKVQVPGTFCQDSKVERYYGDIGALRCLEDGVADVAFVDHVTLAQFKNGKGDQLGLKLNTDDIRLLCQNGSTAPVSDVRKCNWGTIPSSKVISRNDNKDEVIREDARLTLLKAVDNFRPGGKLEIVMRLFGPYYDNPNLLFQDTSVGVVDISQGQNDVNPNLIQDFDYCTTSASAKLNTWFGSLVVVFYAAHLIL